MKNPANRRLKFAAPILVAALLAPATARADDKDAIDYRQHMMNVLNEQAAALGMIASGAAPDDQAVGHFEVIALTAKTALKAFETKAPGGQSKPEVWSNWSDFSKRMTEFAQSSEKVARMGREQGKDVALQNILDALPCKACHDTYRNESKK